LLSWVAPSVMLVHIKMRLCCSVRFLFTSLRLCRSVACVERRCHWRGESFPTRQKVIPSTLKSMLCTNASTNGMLVLGIETSCDDTGAALVNENGEIVGEALHSQTPIHVE